jgi:hypothetical protein
MPTERKKGKGLLLVAVILAILIIILGILYYAILKQSTGTTAKAPAPQAVVQPTTAPVVTPTPTPTDEQILNSEVPDPSQDATELNQDAQGL